MSRIQKLENIYQEQLIKHQVDNVSDFIQSVVYVDITKGKYARFLIESFLNDKFLEEDLIGGVDSTIGQTISLFHKHKHKLTINERSVYALNKETGEALYQSPGDLWNSVKQFQGELSGKELRKEEQEKVYRETEFIYKDEETGFQIISPLTKESAQWWGKGTRWCTSAENNNRFEYYAKQAPLLILLMPDKQKLQLWKDDSYIQFMDESDNSVSLEYIEQNWKLLEPVCLWLNDLKFIPEHLRTKELCELAVQKNGKALDYVLARYKTKEFCELAVSHNGDALKYVPNTFFKKYKDYNMCKIAVKHNGLSLEYVPEYLRTLELCELAIHQNGLTLYYVPEELRTKELCKLAVQQDGMTLANVPLDLKTKELCEIAVKNNGNAIGNVPEEYITKELMELAVKHNGLALQLVPEHLKTNELFKLAVQQNGLTLSFIQKELKTEELCEIAVRHNGLALQLVPLELRTLEICEIAVKQNGTSLGYVPDELKTPEVCQMAVQQDGKSLEYVPNRFKTELQHYVKENTLKLPMDKYQEAFQGIKALFPIKDVSLDYHHL